jgi:hypothetical protein
VIWWYALGMSGPFTEAELRYMAGGVTQSEILGVRLAQERQRDSDDRAPVNDGLPHHEFVPSEFAPESGRCDTCGGGPDAPIHSKPVDQMARIADALERIAAHLEAIRDQGDYIGGRAALALERIAVGEKGPYAL